jgi:hypothetical protein
MIGEQEGGRRHFDQLRETARKGMGRKTSNGGLGLGTVGENCRERQGKNGRESEGE